MRLCLQATGASRGLALGRVRLRLARAFEIEERRIEATQVDEELTRLRIAMACS